MNINSAGHGHQWNKNFVVIASFHTISSYIVAWHLNGYTKWLMLKKDELTRCYITNFIGTVGGFVWAK